MWKDPICGLTDTLDHLDDKTLNIATLTRTLTTCYIEMWANSIVYPGTHTTPDQITDIATTILLDSRIWNDSPLTTAHNGIVFNPWLVYLTTHVVMMATAYGTRAIPPHLLLFRWQNKITHTLLQWAKQINNTNNTANNLEIFSEMVCCILWLDDTPIPRFYQIAQELEELGLRSWYTPAQGKGDRYTELHTNLTTAWMIASAHSHMNRAQSRPPLRDITPHSPHNQRLLTLPIWTPCTVPVAVLGNGLHWDFQAPLTATTNYDKNLILTAYTGKPVRKLHLHYGGNNIRLLGKNCRCHTECDCGTYYTPPSIPFIGYGAAHLARETHYPHQANTIQIRYKTDHHNHPAVRDHLGYVLKTTKAIPKGTPIIVYIPNQQHDETDKGPPSRS